MNRIEVRESKGANIFWASVCVVFGFIFIISEFTDARPGLFIAGIGMFFLIGSVSLLWAIFSNSPTIAIDEDGVWTAIHQSVVDWDNIAEIRIEDGMFVMELSDVKKSHPRASRTSKLLLKRTVTDLSRSDADLDALNSVVERILEDRGRVKSESGANI